MNCAYCNSVIQNDDRFCPACGAPVPLADPIPTPSPYYTVTVVVDPDSVTSAGTQTFNTTRNVGATRLSAPEINTFLQDRSNWAVASMILGLIGVFTVIIPGFCGLITSVPAIILGILSLKSTKRRYAIAGIILGVTSILVGLIIALVFFFTTMMAGDFFQIQ